MFHTSYRNLEPIGGLLKSGPFKQAIDKIGDEITYGFDRPIYLDTLLNIGLIDEFLFGLGAVYPEQKTAADRLARKTAILAFGMVESKFFASSHIGELPKVASDYVNGLVGGKILREAAADALVHSSRLDDPDKWLAYLAYIALCPSPSVFAKEILTCCLMAPMIGPVNRFKNEIRTKVLGMMPAEECLVGPVYRGFEGSFEPTEEAVTIVKVNGSKPNRKRYKKYNTRAKKRTAAELGTIFDSRGY